MRMDLTNFSLNTLRLMAEALQVVQKLIHSITESSELLPPNIVAGTIYFSTIWFWFNELLTPLTPFREDPSG